VPTPTPAAVSKTAYAAGYAWPQKSANVAFDLFSLFNSNFDQINVLVRMSDFAVMAIKRYNQPDFIMPNPTANPGASIGITADGTYEWLVFDKTLATQEYIDRLQGLNGTTSSVAWRVKDAAGTITPVNSTVGAAATGLVAEYVGYPIPSTQGTIPPVDSVLNDYQAFLVVSITP
jgi:hypothetical protein